MATARDRKRPSLKQRAASVIKFPLQEIEYHQIRNGQHDINTEALAGEISRRTGIDVLTVQEVLDIEYELLAKVGVVIEE